MSVWKFILRLGVGALLIWFLLNKHELDVRGIVGNMAGMAGWTIVGALLIDLAGQVLCAYRWCVISGMGGRKARIRDVLPIYFCGMFFNICLPTSIGGDVFRVVGLGRKTGSKTAAFASVFMDRNVGLAALLLLGFVASFVSQTTIHATIFEVPIECHVWPFFVVLSVGFALANVALFNANFYGFVNRILTRFGLAFIDRKLQPLHDALGNFEQPLTNFAYPFLLSMIYQASEIAVIWMLASGLRLDLSPWVLCSMITFQAVAALLPITFSGVGVREAIFTAIIVGKLGPAYKDEAMSLALIYFFGVVLMASLTGGLVYLVAGVPKPSAIEIADTGPETASGE